MRDFPLIAVRPFEFPAKFEKLTSVPEEGVGEEDDAAPPAAKLKVLMAWLLLPD